MNRISDTKVGSKQFSVGRMLLMDTHLLSSASSLLPIFFNRKIKTISYVVAICILFLLASCGKPDNAKLVREGKILLEKSDCKTCHHPVNKGIGPAHTKVAEKYDYTDANVSLLASKMINGGSGTWGDVPMNPHPDLPQEDAEKIARYVLSLDGEEPK